MKKLLLIALLALTPMGHLIAEEAKKPWKNSSELTYVNTTGNTRTESFGAKNKFDYDWAKVALRTEAAANTAKNRDGTTAENYMAQEKFEWKYADPNYLFQLGKWEKDRFAGVDSRLTAGGGYGRQLIKTDRQKLIAEIGAQQSWEDQQNGGYERFGSLRAFGDYVNKITETAEFGQSLEYLKDFDSSKAFRLDSTTYIKSALSKTLSLKVSYQVKFDNEPTPGFGKTDTITKVSLVADF